MKLLLIATLAFAAAVAAVENQSTTSHDLLGTEQLSYLDLEAPCEGCAPDYCYPKNEPPDDFCYKDGYPKCCSKSKGNCPNDVDNKPGCECEGDCNGDSGATRGDRCERGDGTCKGEYFCEVPSGQCGSDDGRCTIMTINCPSGMQEVCGCNGKTYNSECDASSVGVSVDYNSACGSKESVGYVENPDSRKVLDIRNGANSQCTRGTSIDLYEKTGEQWQQFKINNDGSIESIYCPGMVLDVDGGANSGCAGGTKIILWDRTGSNGQKWQMNNDLSIESKLCPNMVLDIKDGNASNGQQIIIWNKSGGSNQEWYLAPLPIRVEIILEEE